MLYLCGCLSFLSSICTQRAANTGWGHEDKESRWGHDKFDGPDKVGGRSGNFPLKHVPEHPVRGVSDLGYKDSHFRAKGSGTLESQSKRVDNREERRSGDADDTRLRDHDRGEGKRPRRQADDEKQTKSREDHDRREGKRSRRHTDDELQTKPREDHDRREDKRSRRHGADDVYVVRSREDIDRREEKKSRRHDDYKFQPESREGQHKGEEKISRHDDEDKRVGRSSRRQ